MSVKNPKNMKVFVDAMIEKMELDLKDGMRT